jgi:hypothetical protein
MKFKPIEGAPSLGLNFSVDNQNQEEAPWF